LSEKSVEAEATRLLPSRPRASRRIGTSSEASLVGPRANRRIGNPSEALWSGASAREGLGEGASARRRVVATRASGESENRPRPCDCSLALIFARFKRSFRFLLRVPLFMVSDMRCRTSQRNTTLRNFLAFIIHPLVTMLAKMNRTSSFSEGNSEAQVHRPQEFES